MNNQHLIYKAISYKVSPLLKPLPKDMSHIEDHCGHARPLDQQVDDPSYREGSQKLFGTQLSADF